MEYTQISLFGKMCQEHSVPTKEKISEPCWKSLLVSDKQMLLFLDLTSGGAKQDISAVMGGASHGDKWMLNIGESPSEERESHLSWILEDNVPEKYYLSAQACRGILNRASRRGKELPEILKTALEDMIEWWTVPR